MNSRQKDVFDFSIKSTVDDILNGYNGTVFAYGQTGAGKSYTMMGTDIDNDEGRGVSQNRRADLRQHPLQPRNDRVHSPSQLYGDLYGTY